MSGDGVLLDSVILIDHFNGVAAATGFLQACGTPACISPITRAEVLTGLEGRERQLAARFLDCFHFLSIDRETADLAAELRKTQRWRFPDAFQAAVAQIHGLRLATRNTADFNPRRHPFVVVPYTL